MKKLLTAALLSIGLTGIAAADPIEGVWQTEVDDSRHAHIKMQPCGAAICGVIVKSFENGVQYNSPNNGKTLVIDMVPSGGGKYNGKVWRPSNNKIYVGKMKLSGNSLKMSGCVAGGLICSKQTWKRLN